MNITLLKRRVEVGPTGIVEEVEDEELWESKDTQLFNWFSDLVVDGQRLKWVTLESLQDIQSELMVSTMDLQEIISFSNAVNMIYRVEENDHFIIQYES